VHRARAPATRNTMTTTTTTTSETAAAFWTTVSRSCPLRPFSRAALTTPCAARPTLIVWSPGRHAWTQTLTFYRSCRAWVPACAQRDSNSTRHHRRNPGFHTALQGPEPPHPDRQFAHDRARATGAHLGVQARDLAVLGSQSPEWGAPWGGEWGYRLLAKKKKKKKKQKDPPQNGRGYDPGRATAWTVMESAVW
jgi:hypothetical protein